MPVAAVLRRRRRHLRHPHPLPPCHLIAMLTLLTATIVWRRSGPWPRGHGAAAMAAVDAPQRHHQLRNLPPSRPPPPSPLIVMLTTSTATIAWRRSGLWPRGPGVVDMVAVAASQRRLLLLQRRHLLLQRRLPRLQRLRILIVTPGGTIGNLDGQMRRSSGAVGRSPRGAQTSPHRRAPQWIARLPLTIGRLHGASKRKRTVASMSTRAAHLRLQRLPCRNLPHHALPWTAAWHSTIGRLPGGRKRKRTVASTSIRAAHHRPLQIRHRQSRHTVRLSTAMLHGPIGKQLGA